MFIISLLQIHTICFSRQDAYVNTRMLIAEANMGQNPGDSEVRRGARDRVRRERYLRCVPFARVRRWQRDGLLRLL